MIWHSEYLCCIKAIYHHLLPFNFNNLMCFQKAVRLYADATGLCGTVSLVYCCWDLSIKYSSTFIQHQHNYKSHWFIVRKPASIDIVDNQDVCVRASSLCVRVLLKLQVSVWVGCCAASSGLFESCPWRG